jgi:hypothetical protein
MDENLINKKLDLIVEEMKNLKDLLGGIYTNTSALSNIETRLEEISSFLQRSSGN